MAMASVPTDEESHRVVAGLGTAGSDLEPILGGDGAARTPGKRSLLKALALASAAAAAAASAAALLAWAHATSPSSAPASDVDVVGLSGAQVSTGCSCDCSWTHRNGACNGGGDGSCCWEQCCHGNNGPVNPPPSKYHPKFDTTPDYLDIASTANGVKGNGGKVSDNYYLVIGDMGGCNGGCNGCCGRQKKVAQHMKQYIADRKRDNPDSKLLFVLAVGDNFYWTGASKNRFVGWKQVYGEELTSVPWFAVMGNHDFGNDDVGAGCPHAKPRFTCDKNNLNSKACGGARPYSTEKQVYDSNALNTDKGGVDGDVRRNWHQPDYTYYYSIPELDFEIVAMDWNAADFGGLGGDGPHKSARRTAERCGSIANFQKAMQNIQDASTDLMHSRSAAAAAKNVAIIGHYPHWAQGGTDFREMFVKGLPESKVDSTKVFNFFGHTHVQECYDKEKGECVNFLTGGGGGCCGNGDLPGGFTAITFNEEATQVVECFAPDSRCSLSRFAFLGDEAPGVGEDVCHHTIDDPSCPGYAGPIPESSQESSQEEGSLESSPEDSEEAETKD